MNGAVRDPGHTNPLPPLQQDRGSAFSYGAVLIGQDGDFELWAQIIVDEAQLAEHLRRCATRDLPPNTRYEIVKQLPHNFGRSHGMGWHHHPNMAEAETWDVVPEEPLHLPNRGIILIGQYTTPNPGNWAVPDVGSTDPRPTS